MTPKTRAATIGLLAIMASTSAAPALSPAPPYDQLGPYRARGENPDYHVNEYGYGNYVQGPNGSYGGYPAGSAGAIELRNEHDIKCRYAPETC